MRLTDDLAEFRVWGFSNTVSIYEDVERMCNALSADERFKIRVLEFPQTYKRKKVEDIRWSNSNNVLINLKKVRVPEGVLDGYCEWSLKNHGIEIEYYPI